MSTVGVPAVWPSARVIIGSLIKVLTVSTVVVVPLTVRFPVMTKLPPTLAFLATPNPPAVTILPVVVSVLSVVSVTLSFPFAANVVNLPLPRVVVPISTLSIFDNVPGLIVTVPVGLRLALVVAVQLVNLAALAVVVPMVILSIVPTPAGLIVT